MLAILVERLYQQTGDLDDLQEAVAWAEQAVAATQLADKAHGLDKVVLGLCIALRVVSTEGWKDYRAACALVEEVNATLKPHNPCKVTAESLLDI
jgi:hypothetical protein